MNDPFILKSVVLYIIVLATCLACNSDSNSSDEAALIENYVSQQSVSFTKHASGFYYTVQDSGGSEIPTTVSTVIIEYDMFDLQDNVLEQVSVPLTIEIQRLFDGVVTGLRLIGRTG